MLVVDDEPAIREMIRFVLGKSGMKVRSAASGREALEKIGEKTPDILLLDWMMPNLSGTELTRHLRKSPLTRDIPIIMLTAKMTEDDKVTGLNAGADDYITKPFSPRELIARIHAVLRRIRPEIGSEVLEFGDISLNTAEVRVSRAGRPVKLGPTEFKLLRHFMEHPTRVYSREQLLDAVWGHDIFIEVRTVDVHIRRLRRALCEEGEEDVIRTVRAAGYALDMSKT